MNPLKEYRNMKKKITAVIAALIMCAGVMPVAAYAQESSVPSSNTSNAGPEVSFEEKAAAMMLPEAEGEKLTEDEAREVIGKINSAMNSQENFTFSLKVEMLSENFSDTIEGKGVMAPVKKEALVTSLGKEESEEVMTNYFKEGKVYINNPSTKKWGYRAAELNTYFAEIFSLSDLTLSAMDVYKTDSGYMFRTKPSEETISEPAPSDADNTLSNSSSGSKKIREKSSQETDICYLIDNEFRFKAIYNLNKVTIKKGSGNAQTYTFAVTEFKDYGTAPEIEFPAEIEGAEEITNIITPKSSNTSNTSNTSVPSGN